MRCCVLGRGFCALKNAIRRLRGAKVHCLALSSHFGHSAYQAQRMWPVWLEAEIRCATVVNGTFLKVCPPTAARMYWQCSVRGARGARGARARCAPRVRLYFSVISPQLILTPRTGKHRVTLGHAVRARGAHRLWQGCGDSEKYLQGL